MKLIADNFHIIGAKDGLVIEDPSPDDVAYLKDTVFRDIAGKGVSIRYTKMRMALGVPSSVSDEDVEKAVDIARTEPFDRALSAISMLNTISSLGERAIHVATAILKWINGDSNG